jgi:hypothetical protein
VCPESRSHCEHAGSLEENYKEACKKQMGKLCLKLFLNECIIQ